jgi:hypothetical protein
MTKTLEPPKIWVGWPPQYLIRKSILPLKNKSRDEWTREEWIQYAMLLEEKGKELAQRTRVAEMELLECQIKLSRDPIAKQALIVWRERVRRRGLVGRLWPKKSQPTRGRPRDEVQHQRAHEALQIKAELEASGKRVADMRALEEWYRRKGQRISKARKDNAHALMGKLRRAKNLQK